MAIETPLIESLVPDNTIEVVRDPDGFKLVDARTIFISISAHSFFFDRLESPSKLPAAIISDTFENHEITGEVNAAYQTWGQLYESQLLGTIGHYKHADARSNQVIKFYEKKGTR